MQQNFSPGKLYRIVSHFPDESNDSYAFRYFQSCYIQYDKRFKVEKPVMFLSYVKDSGHAAVLTNNGKIDHINLVSVNLEPFKDD